MQLVTAAVIVLAVLVACTSGAPRSDGENRILGGQEAEPGEFPWMVRTGGKNQYYREHKYPQVNIWKSLGMNNVSLRRAKHFCGGSIIGASTILTASHCVVGLDAAQITVVSGSTKLDQGGSSTKVDRVITHPNYDEQDSWRNDVAILQLKTPITFSDSVKAIPIPAQDEATEENGASRVSGWGYTSFPSLLVPNDLQKLNLTLVANDACDAAFVGNTVYPTNVCAGTITGEGVCNGDSGGPLVANGKQIGIVSWGRSCATGIPDVYTRVASYADWIAENLITV